MGAGKSGVGGRFMSAIQADLRCRMWRENRVPSQDDVPDTRCHHKTDETEVGWRRSFSLLPHHLASSLPTPVERFLHLSLTL